MIPASDACWNPDQMDETNMNDALSVFLNQFLFVLLQGEKGEPGFVIAADGSMMSGLAGPVGPKGVKVVLVVAALCIMTSSAKL